MNKKVIIALSTLVTFGAMALTGCGTVSSSSASTANPNAPINLNLYATGDTNVQQLWDNVIIPAFEQKYPNIKVHDNFLTHGQGQQAVLAKLKAAKDNGNKTVDVDLYEGGPGDVQQGRADDLWQKLSNTDISNLGNVQQGLLVPVDNYAVPYRASSVVLAYNSNNVPNPPQTFNDLIQWIKSHPGKFSYNDPSTGGAGQAFVVEALYNFMNPSEMGSGYDSSVESNWTQGFDLLKSLGPDMYQKGVYPKGNQGALDLLANGSIDMAPVWSDMATSQLSQGTLPANIKLTQISPGFTGGGSYLLVPSLSANKSAAFKFINFLLSPDMQAKIVKKINGYPAINWSLLPSDIQTQFIAISKDYRYWPGQYTKDMLKMWQQSVPNQ